MTKAEWFAGTFLFEVVVSGKTDDDDPLVEKRVVLFEGRDEAEATEKASQYCRTDLVEYENEFGERVAWRCSEVVAVTPLLVTELRDGVEVYSELLGGARDISGTQKATEDR